MLYTTLQTTNFKEIKQKYRPRQRSIRLRNKNTNNWSPPRWSITYNNKRHWWNWNLGGGWGKKQKREKGIVREEGHVVGGGELGIGGALDDAGETEDAGVQDGPSLFQLRRRHRRPTPPRIDRPCSPAKSQSPAHTGK